MVDDVADLRRTALAAATAMFDWLTPGAAPADLAAAEEWLLDLECWKSGEMPPPPGQWDPVPEGE